MKESLNYRKLLNWVILTPCYTQAERLHHQLHVLITFCIRPREGYIVGIYFNHDSVWGIYFLRKSTVQYIF